MGLSLPLYRSACWLSIHLLAYNPSAGLQSIWWRGCVTSDISLCALCLCLFLCLCVCVDVQEHGDKYCRRCVRFSLKALHLLDPDKCVSMGEEHEFTAKYASSSLYHFLLDTLYPSRIDTRHPLSAPSILQDTLYQSRIHIPFSRIQEYMYSSWIAEVRERPDSHSVPPPKPVSVSLPDLCLCIYLYLSLCMYRCLDWGFPRLLSHDDLFTRNRADSGFLHDNTVLIEVG